ncbi:SRPBCC family protein [Streptomyces bauhiniae]|uniref:SRPBCC family protein n=1 Tax=Streptomyces bauhiniae TaxID=2340725 RepID=A0A7K3QU63_9ACTN|nr:SRPBCC family protein [Streptomyces bauhiniae]NEB93449.1 SRPBCC family protein [Streptomyces bauhiniae]
MSSIDVSVEVRVPVRTAYDQWTQFKSFPRIMNAVQHVDQVGPAMTRWKVRTGLLTKEFMAEIVEQEPDSHIAWRSVGRHPWLWGEVSFREAAPDRTVITVTMHIEPHGLTGRLPDSANRARKLVRESLENFKEFIEGLGDASGAWRASIHNGRVSPAEPDPPRSRVPKWPVG